MTDAEIEGMVDALWEAGRKYGVAQAQSMTLIDSTPAARSALLAALAAPRGDPDETAGAAPRGEARDALPYFDKRAADTLAWEVQRLIDRKVLDSRSPAADALLDYVNPGPNENVVSKLAASRAPSGTPEEKP